MQYIVDRIEEELVVCEDQSNGEMLAIPRSLFAQALREGDDFVYIHVEAPDECGHRGEAANKVKAIEDIDRRILGPLLEELAEMGDFSLLVAPDHPTPLAIRTHSADPAPYLLYRSFAPAAGGPARGGLPVMGYPCSAGDSNSTGATAGSAPGSPHPWRRSPAPTGPDPGP